MWYDAEVRELGERAGARAVLVHWAGWEDHWDEWLPAPRVMAQPPRPPPPGADAGVELSPEALAAAREQALEANDMWQFNMFVGVHGGTHIGYCQSYVVAEPGGAGGAGPGAGPGGLGDGGVGVGGGGSQELQPRWS